MFLEILGNCNVIWVNALKCFPELNGCTHDIVGMTFSFRLVKSPLHILKCWWARLIRDKFNSYAAAQCKAVFCKASVKNFKFPEIFEVFKNNNYSEELHASGTGPKPNERRLSGDHSETNFFPSPA